MSMNPSAAKIIAFLADHTFSAITSCLSISGHLLTIFVVMNSLSSEQWFRILNKKKHVWLNIQSLQSGFILVEFELISTLCTAWGGSQYQNIWKDRKNQIKSIINKAIFKIRWFLDTNIPNLNSTEKIMILIILMRIVAIICC